MSSSLRTASSAARLTRSCATFTRPLRQTTRHDRALQTTLKTASYATTTAPRAAYTASTTKSASTPPSTQSSLDRYKSNVPPGSPTPFPDPQPATPPPAVASEVSASSNGATPVLDTYDNGTTIDWASSFHGLSTTPFEPTVAAALQKEIPTDDVEIKPDGIIYLPEIKYRRILNQAFGPGGWGLAPRGELHVGDKVVSRTYALVAHGRFISEARGECQYFSTDTITTAGEGCKSNALLRCCKDLGIASELWDPRFIRDFKKKHAHEIWVEHVPTKKKRQIWTLKGVDPTYPFKKS